MDSAQQAKADTIDDLEPYRDNSMPTFLFYSVSVKKLNVVCEFNFVWLLARDSGSSGKRSNGTTSRKNHQG